MRRMLLWLDVFLTARRWSSLEEGDVSRHRLRTELFYVTRGRYRAAPHWNWRVFVPVFTGRIAFGAFSVSRAPIYEKRLLSPQETFYATGSWAPYYAARLPI